jgi:hypothetical protein
MGDVRRDVPRCNVITDGKHAKIFKQRKEKDFY